MADDFVVASIEMLTVWNFYNTKEDAENSLPRIVEDCIKSARKCAENHVVHGYDERDPDYWLKQAGKYLIQANTYKVMTYDEYESAKAEKILSEPIKEISKEKFEYALNVLPPLRWGCNNGVSSFFMSEFLEGPYTEQYAKIGGKFYSKTVNFYKKETWMFRKAVHA